MLGFTWFTMSYHAKLEDPFTKPSKIATCLEVKVVLSFFVCAPLSAELWGLQSSLHVNGIGHNLLGIDHNLLVCFM